VAIEIDGWAWHSAPDRFQRDRTKQNDLLGWTVLRFTWFDLSQNPDDVIRRVRAALRHSGVRSA
jgi:very-short-patch-repair endonuclease